MKIEVRDSDFKEFATLSSEDQKEILAAGAEVMIAAWKAGAVKHRGKTGSMEANIRAGEYHMDITGGSVAVYPQGSDPRGVSNAVKAYVTNYGYAGRKTKKTGDKWVNQAVDANEAAAGEAMADKYYEIINKDR